MADVEAWPEHISKVTAEDVIAAARHVLKDTSSVTALLLPADKKNEPRKATAAPGGQPMDGPDDDGPDSPPGAPGAGEQH